MLSKTEISQTINWREKVVTVICKISIQNKFNTDSEGNLRGTIIYSDQH